MQTEKYPFAVRLLGFPPEEARAIALGLHRAPRKGAAYFCLSDGSLQEPDLYLANGADLRALAALDSLAGDIHPALVLGAPPVCLPYPSLRLPVRWGSVYSALDELLKRRAGALDKLACQGAPQRSDRRRRERLDLDLTEAADYAAMRRHAHRGAVLVLDRSPAFSLHVGRLLLAWRRACRWADNEDEAVAICRQGEVALVLINTATPGIDPYRVCAALRQSDGLHGLRGRDSAQCAPPAVVFLAAPPFIYDAQRAHAAGAEGVLDKPVADHHLLELLRRELDLPALLH
ncbi:response regulator [Massilia sp. YIM B04103]|uniref:response regulator n=1 Tax=Massilia sp. YIM B04103 TaxID=2963106 RepID=UPI00210CF08F|nr:response regulator [Massilia sp. YIM B04103]